MLEKVPLSITNRGTFEVFEGKILRNTGGGDRTEFPEISMAALREALRNASSTTRNQ